MGPLGHVQTRFTQLEHQPRQRNVRHYGCVSAPQGTGSAIERRAAIGLTAVDCRPRLLDKKGLSAGKSKVERVAPIILVDNPYQSAANIDTTQEQAYSKTLYPKTKGVL